MFAKPRRKPSQMQRTKFLLTFSGRIFSKRCTRCGHGIQPNELVMRARDNIYHIQCFTCNWCNTTLAQGDYFGLKDRDVYCRTHYEMITYGSLHYLSSEGAMHPSTGLAITGDHHHLADPLMPHYGSIYSAGNGLTLPHFQAGGGAPTGGTGVRKGRPRKKKALPDGGQLVDSGASAVSSCGQVQSPSLGR